MQNRIRTGAAILACLLVAAGGVLGAIATPAAAEDDSPSRLREESAAGSAPTPPLAAEPQKPHPTWNENDPYLRSLIDPFESNAARDQRFGRENALTSPRVDPDF